jgi:GNAT superfamily N-acetyltransferase
LLIIDFIGQYTGFIPIVAKWHQDEWHHISPHLSTELRVSLYHSYTNTSSIPCCLLAIDNNIPVGSASLLESDMHSHPHLSPWLASVFVPKNYRGRGIASQLISQCLENARENNIQTLYLFTPNQMEFYLKRGWELIEHTIYQGEDVDIMAYKLNTD